MTTEALPNGLTAGPPGLAHLLYMLTLYRYVLLCFLFGLLSVILGVALLTMAVMMRSRTTSVHLLESVPLYMPAMILICNGASMVAFMHKQSRRFYLLKSVCGLFLLSALLLIIVCVTTSVIHLPRLHSHTECAYTGRLRACTCVQKVDSSETSIASKHFIMEDIASCELVHGTLYDSLRVVFALSLVAILTSVFSIMTLYQLYIYEKQKIYFSQINSLRHRIHQQQQQQHHHHQHQQQQPHYHHHHHNHHRHSAASVLPNDGQSNPNSSYLLNHFNHLYAIDGMTNSVKCLSAEFSSQDLLLDQSSTNFGVSKPKSENAYQQQMSHVSSIHSRSSRIWSSQLSHSTNGGHFHAQTSDAQGSSECSESRPLCFDHKVEDAVERKVEEQDCLTANEDDDERNGGEGKGSSPEEAVSITPVPSKQFTFGSSSQHRLDNHQQHRQHYLTTFEEAFKNYYDSQHRLSSGAGDSQQNNSNHNNNHSNLLDNQDTAAPAHHYYTMPAKKSEHQRSKRRRTYIAQVEIPVQQAEDLHQQQQQQQQQAVFCINTDLNSMMMADVIDEPPCLLYQHSLQYHHGAPVNENMNQEQTTAGHHQQYMSEEEPFPAIEPPADYKNAITIEEIVPNHLTAESKTRTMEQLTSQLMQPYQIWMQQFIEQMNALNYPTAQVVEDDAARDKIMIAYPNVQSVQAVAGAGAGDGYATQGDFVDDEEDDAGDTSTSQDIADFELELDEEPIQFVEVDEEYKKPVEKPAVLVPVETIQPVDVQPKQQQQQLPPVVTSHNEVAKIVTPPKDHSQNQQQQPQQMYPIDLLKKNTELIWRAVKMNKASADYGFDGFRKGCFDDGDDSSSTSSTSSLTNGETTTNDSHDNSSDSGSSQSITAEYIKPPTPFTNNFLCQ